MLHLVCLCEDEPCSDLHFEINVDGEVSFA